MNPISQIRNYIRIGELYPDHSVVVHFIPDFGTKLIDYITEDFLFNPKLIQTINVSGSTLKEVKIKVDEKSNYYRELKSILPRTHDDRFKFQQKILDRKFFIVDHSLFINKLQRFNNLRKIQLLFQHLTNSFLNYKIFNVQQIPLFCFRDDQSLIKLLIRYLPTFEENKNNLSFFDFKVLGTLQNKTISFIYFDQNKIKIDIPALKKLASTYTEFTGPEEVQIEVPAQFLHKEPARYFRQIRTEINDSKLEQVFGQKIIQNEVIKKSIEKIIETIPDDYKTNHEDLRKYVFIKLYETLHGPHKEIPNDFLNDPEKVFNQLNLFSEHSVPISFNKETSKNILIQPNNKFITLNKITGPVRHHFEFNESLENYILKLFKTLEEKSHPIEVLGIEKTIEDNNVHRYYRYKITLKNLSGGYSKPYEIYLKIPALVNDKYFKLNGKEYILSSQQFLKPLTKNNPHEARFISHFNMITIGFVNAKHLPSEIEEVIKYIGNKYTRDLKEYSGTKIVFKNGSVIDLENKEMPFKFNNKSVRLENGNYYLFEGEEKVSEIPLQLREFLYDHLINELEKINPKDKTVATKSLQYINIHIMGVKLPLILALWQQLGLTNSLLKLGIDFSIDDQGEGNYSFKLNDGKFLNIFPKSKREEFIVNGLKKFEYFETLTSEDIGRRESIFDYLVQNYGTKILNNLDTMVEIAIDPFTKQYLEFENLPTNIIDIITGPQLDKLFNDPVDHPSDLSSMRVRLSEYIAQLLYNEIAMAYRTYKDSLAYDKEDAKLRFDENYLIKNLLNQHEHSESIGSSLINYIEPFSPVDEIVKSSKVVRTGKNGVPSKNAFKKSHRNVHPTYIGNIAAHSTTESTDVGLVNFHTLGASIDKNLGHYIFKPTNFDQFHWDSISIDESLVPFLNSMDSARLIIARTHMGQKIPIIDPELPLVQTGAEFIVPKIVSSKFAHRAKKNGKVIKVSENEYLKVEYEDGTTETFDINPRYGTTKRNSVIHISLEHLNEGDKFQKDDLVAWSKSFKDNGLAIGKNVRVAILNYIGRSHEDGYVISENMSNNFKTEFVIRVPAIIPPGVKILDFKNINTETKINENLVSFQYKQEINIDQYVDDLELYNPDSDLDQPELEELYSSDKNQNSITVSSPGGRIIDIKIKLNTRKDIDPFILSLWEKQNKKLKNISHVLKKDLLDNSDMSVLKIGGHKLKGKEFEGALVEFYISNIKPLKIGDKISNRHGAKGVVNHIIPKDFIPYLLRDKTQTIDIFLAPAAILGRKNTAILKELYLGKLLVEMKEKIKKFYLDKGFEFAKSRLKEFYQFFGDEYSEFVDQLDEKFFKQKLFQPEFQLNIIVPPFSKNITFAKLKDIAKRYDIPLDEEIVIPELNNVTRPVPVGYIYMSAMEQLADDYESTRTIAGYSAITGQPLKGKSRMGGQSLGNLDVYNLLTYNINKAFLEFFTARSDNIYAKNEMIFNIIENGKTNLPTSIRKGKAQNLMKVLMLGIGLNVEGKF